MIHVLVDIDETMVSVPPGINAKTSAVMFKKIYGIDANEEMIDNVGKTELGIIKEILIKFKIQDSVVPEEAYKVWAQALDEELARDPVQILPGMVEFLKTLSNNPEVNLVLLTGNSPWRAESKLKSAGFEKYFKDKNGNLKGVFGDMTPKREELFPLLKKQCQEEDKFIVVDDSLIGAKMANDFGLKLISVETGRAKKEDLQRYTDYVYKDFGDGRWKTAVQVVLGA